MLAFPSDRKTMFRAGCRPPHTHTLLPSSSSNPHPAPSCFPSVGLWKRPVSQKLHHEHPAPSSSGSCFLHTGARKVRPLDQQLHEGGNSEVVHPSKGWYLRIKGFPEHRGWLPVVARFHAWSNRPLSPEADLCPYHPGDSSARLRSRQGSSRQVLLNLWVPTPWGFIKWPFHRSRVA